MKTTDIHKYIESLGGRVVELRRNKHWVCRAEFDGVIIPITVPNSPSDGRSMRNNKSQILKNVKEAKEKANDLQG